MQRMLKLLSVIGLLTLLLAACGQGTATNEATTAPSGGEATTAPSGGEATTAPADGEATTAPADGEATTAPADGAATSAPTAGSGTTLVLWTKEGQADGGLQFVQKLAQEFGEANGVTIEVVNKGTEDLRTEFQTAALAGSGPDLLWTVNDHAGPFVLAGIIKSVDEVGVDVSNLVGAGADATRINDQVWGVPITVGNQLLLLYNKRLIQEAPKTTDELLSVAKEHTDPAAGTFGLVYNQTEPFWLVPWLGGFGGQVFAEDGTTPNLNTPEMVNTLKFLKDLKDQGIVPPESNYETADSLFQQGKAAMIINGDWALAQYGGATASVTATQNVELGVAPLPDVSATGQPAAPYTSGAYFMFPTTLEGEKLEVAKQFVEYVTSQEIQARIASELKRLPALESELNSEQINSDPLLAGAAEALTRGTGMPPVAEMRCNWDAMKPQMQAVLNGELTPEEAAEEMQVSAETCVQDLQ